jgi:hypothetical protein
MKSSKVQPFSLTVGSETPDRRKMKMRDRILMFFFIVYNVAIPLMTIFALELALQAVHRQATNQHGPEDLLLFLIFLQGLVLSILLANPFGNSGLE